MFFLCNFAYSFRPKTPVIERLKFYFNYLDAQYTGYAPVIRIAVFITILLALLYLLTFVHLIILGYKSKRKSKRWNKISKKYETCLQNIIFSQETMEQETIMNTLNIKDSDIRHRWQKETFTKLILHVKDKQTKKYKQQPEYNLNVHNYKAVLIILGIDTYWTRIIWQGSDKQKARALRKVEELTHDVTTGIVAPLLFDSNDTLRKISRISFMKFSHEDPFKFLEEGFDKNFTPLDAVKIHDVIAVKISERNYDFSFFNRLIINNSENEDFQSFLVGEIATLNLKENAPFLTEYFKNTNNNKIKAKIAQTLGKLKYENALSMLIEEFPLSHLSTQYQIIDAVGMIGKESSQSFLKDAYRNAYNNYMRLKIINALGKCGGNIAELDIHNEVQTSQTNTHPPITNDVSKDAVSDLCNT